MSDPDYSIRISRRAKYMQLRLTREGALEVVLPEGASRRRVPAFVASKRDWITRVREAHGRRSRAREETRNALPSSIDLPGLDEQWHIAWHCVPARRPRLIESTPHELVISGDTESHHACREILRQWLKARARATLPGWLERVSQRTGLRYSRVSIRGQRSRWGSCSSRGNISLNYKLLFLVPELIEYLLVHELCHTIHMNHSPQYWALVADKLPDHRARDRELRHAGPLVPAWVGCDGA